MIAKFMHSDNGTLCISSQIRIKVTYVIPKKKMQSTWLKHKVATLEHEPEMRERQKKGEEFSLSWNIVGVGLKKAHGQCARLWQMQLRL